MEADVQPAMEREQQEQEVEVGETTEVSVPTQKELATALVSTPTPTPDHTYSTTESFPMPTQILPILSSSVPTPMPIYSTLTTASATPSILVPIWIAIMNTLRYALGQGPHPAMLTQQSTLVQSTTSVQSPISSPMVSAPPPFNAHLDTADMEFLKRKLEKCKGKLGNALYNAGKPNHYFRVVAVLEKSLHEDSGVALTDRLR